MAVTDDDSWRHWLRFIPQIRVLDRRGRLKTGAWTTRCPELDGACSMDTFTHGSLDAGLLCAFSRRSNASLWPPFSSYAQGEERIAKLFDSPSMPEAECSFKITSGGIADTD